MNEQSHQLRFPADPSGQGREPRCLDCGYRLSGLVVAACPECGRRFDPEQQRTYSFNRPYIWYRYWSPGITLSLGCGMIWVVLFYAAGELGWGLFLGVPWMIGALFGYRSNKIARSGLLIAKIVLLTTLVALVGLTMAGGLAGLFCGVFLLFFFLPVGVTGLLFGVACARVLTTILKQTAFSQREFLPLLVVILLLPGVAHLLEKLFAPPIDTATVSTTHVLEMDRDRAWDAWVFYEDVDHRPPLLLRLGLPLPSHTEGWLNAVGDTQVCVYTGDARLVKQATEIKPTERLAFDVVGQEHFENNSIRLIDGSFAFTDAGEDATAVTLTTRYEPLLRPRALWGPIEHTVAQSLHKHVLRGMETRDLQNQYVTLKTRREGGQP